jgi:methionyl-tRNA formyltransferase
VETTGVTFMITDEGWDTGPVLASFTVPVLGRDTCGTLEERLSLLAAARLMEVLESYHKGDLIPQPQSGVSVYADKISPDEGIVDWGDTAISIDRKIRAFQPRPGARTTCRGRMLKIVEVSLRSGDENVPGYVTILGDTMVVQTGEGALEILTVQPESKKAMSAAEFLRGARMESGEILGS